MRSSALVGSCDLSATRQLAQPEKASTSSGSQSHPGKNQKPVVPRRQPPILLCSRVMPRSLTAAAPRTGGGTLTRLPHVPPGDGSQKPEEAMDVAAYLVNIVHGRCRPGGRNSVGSLESLDLRPELRTHWRKRLVREKPQESIAIALDGPSLFR